MLFKLKITSPSKKPKPSYKRGKITTGLVIEEDEEFKVLVKDKDKNTTKTFPFTPESFDLKGRRNVFTRYKENGKRVRIIRDATACKIMPGLPEQYLPFDNNWTIKGHIVKHNNIYMFDFKSLIGYNEYIILDI